MALTTRTTILTRTSQCLAAAALMAGLAFGAAPITTAEEPALDMEVFEDCIARNKDRYFPSDTIAICCRQAGGTPQTGEGGAVVNCNAPPAEGPGAPTGKPGVTPLPLAPNDGVGPGAPKPGVTPLPLAPNNGVG